MTSKEGFSVVAPMRMMLPFSTKGRKASCCALLKRWISSTKTMVFSPKRRFSSASCITPRISLMPLVTAEKLMNLARVWLAMTWARVVFPTPGGPQKIMEETMSCWMILRSTFPSPKRCCCPTTSSMVWGRSRAGSGWAIRLPAMLSCSSIVPPFSFAGRLPSSPSPPHGVPSLPRAYSSMFCRDASE